MKFNSVCKATISLATLIAAVGLSPTSFAAADADAAQALMKKSDCFKCHAIDKKKDGTPYKEVAKKYKGKADAEETLIKHMTSKPMVEIDGKKEEHKAIKSSDPAEIRNAAQWILSL
jgi:cytochrome c